VASKSNEESEKHVAVVNLVVTVKRRRATLVPFQRSCTSSRISTVNAVQPATKGTKKAAVVEGWPPWPGRQTGIEQEQAGRRAGQVVCGEKPGGLRA